MVIKQFSKWICLFVGALSFSTAAFASCIETPLCDGPFFSIFGGANFETGGEAIAVKLAGLNTNFYQANDKSATGPTVGGNIGYRKSLQRKRMWGSIGAESSYTIVTCPYGRVRPLFLISPNFDELKFNYQVQSIPLFGMLSVGGRFDWFEPYVTGGLGVSWNRAFNYNEVPANPDGTALPMRTMFRNRTQGEFAWTVGAGFGYRATASTVIGLEYRYTNYGHAALSPTEDQITSQKLKLGEVRSNAIIARMTFHWNSPS